MLRFILYWAIWGAIEFLLFILIALASYIADNAKSPILGKMGGAVAAVCLVLKILMNWLALPAFLAYWLFFNK